MAFREIAVYTRARGAYRERRHYGDEGFRFADLAALNAALSDVIQWIKESGVPVQNGREG